MYLFDVWRSIYYFLLLLFLCYVHRFVGNIAAGRRSATGDMYRQHAKEMRGAMDVQLQSVVSEDSFAEFLEIVRLDAHIVRDKGQTGLGLFFW